MDSSHGDGIKDATQLTLDRKMSLEFSRFELSVIVCIFFFSHVLSLSSVQLFVTL